MAQPLIDQLMKKMAERHVEDFIRLAFPETDFQVISTKLDKELVIETREVDVAIKILSEGKEHLLHFEFQTEYDPTISQRMFVYAAALTAKYHLDVTSVLFQLKPPPKKIRSFDSYRVKLFGRETNQFKFPVVKLWEHREAILSGKKPYLSFAPLLLEISEKPDEALLRKQRELILLEEDSGRRLELLGLCLALASRHFNFKFLKSFFEEDTAMLETLEEVPYIGEKIKRAKDEGRKEGEINGKIVAIREAIFELLTNRFNFIDKETSQSLKAIDDPEILKIVFRKALQAESLEAFKQAVREMVKALE